MSVCSQVLEAVLNPVCYSLILYVYVDWRFFMQTRQNFWVRSPKMSDSLGTWHLVAYLQAACYWVAQKTNLIRENLRQSKTSETRQRYLGRDRFFPIARVEGK